MNPEYPDMNDRPQDQEWRILAEQAAEEKDPTRLIEIIRALTAVLDKEEARNRQHRDA